MEAIRRRHHAMRQSPNLGQPECSPRSTLCKQFLCADAHIESFTFEVVPEFGPVGPWEHPTILFPNGTAKLVFEGGEASMATPNQALLLNGGERFVLRRDTAPFAGDGLALKPTFLAQITNEPHFNGRTAVVQDVDYVTLRMWYRRAERMSGTVCGSHQLELLKAWLLGWVELLPKPQFVSRCTVERHQVVEGIKEYLAANVARDPKLPELSRVSGLPPYYLARSFLTETGYTLKRFHHGLRMRAAFEALQAGRADITEVSANLGYDEDRHLVRALRLSFGLVPNRFR